MRLNNHLALSTSKLLLVPYSAHHVPTYHTWIQDPALQAATASEPLSLDKEYAMQQSWRTDHDKLTFIICLPLPEDHDPAEALTARRHDFGERMIGDINLFLCDAEPEIEQDPDGDAEQDSNQASAPTPSRVVGEIELMIALPSLQRQGYGRAALATFMNYILSNWPAIAKEYSTDSPPLAHLRARINQTNSRSIALFSSLGFTTTSETANYFGEVELRWNGTVEETREFRGWEEPKMLKYRE